MSLHLGSDLGTRAPVDLPEEDLLRHAVILGATGSGKTVLAKAILEEAVRSGIPVIAVDSQGDLASLALAPTQASRTAHPVAPETVDAYWSRAAVAILTPGSRRGVPRSLNPLRPPPPSDAGEEAILYLDALAEGLATVMGYKPSSDLGGRAKDAIFLALQGALGRGRWPRDLGELPALLEKETSSDGAVLTKRERSALVRRSRSMTVGAKGLLFTVGPPLDVENLMTWPPEGHVPVNIVYVGGLRSAAERETVVATLCEEVYHWMTFRPSSDLRLVLYLDEVAGLCPPHPKNPPAKKFLSLLFRQARKYGVGLIVATQNVTDLDYKVLGQANTWALGRLLAKQDLDRVRHLIASLRPGDAGAVLEAIPSLRAGQFVLLSPEHLGDVVRLEVRGLATQHVVLAEEKFREAQSSHALAAGASAPDSQAARRSKLATAAAKAARLAAKMQVEEGIGPKVLRIFEELPGMYGPEEIAGMTALDRRFLAILLRKMEEAHLLRVEPIDGRDVYWDPTVGFDVRRGVPARVGLLPLRFPLVKAAKVARDDFRRRMLVFPQERFVRKDFYYVPLWRIEGEMPLGRKSGRRARSFYINAVTGDIAHGKGRELSFEAFPARGGAKYEPLFPKSLLERGPSAKIGDPVPLAKLGLPQAADVVRRSFGADPDPSDAELVLLPVWRFDLESHRDRGTRTLWIDGTLGTVLHTPPERSAGSEDANLA